MSLVEITTPPSAENAALRLHRADTVAIARTRLAPGQVIRPGEDEVRVQEAIPAGHKVAIRAMAQGEVVRRYGEAIGRASQPIRRGSTCTPTTWHSKRAS